MLWFPCGLSGHQSVGSDVILSVKSVKLRNIYRNFLKINNFPEMVDPEDH